MDIKAVLAPIGLVFIAISLAMIAPIIADLEDGNPDWMVFVLSMIITGTVGAVLFSAFRRPDMRLNRREAIMFVVLVWLAAGVASGLPFYFAALPVTLTESIFEAVSGLTTTGATVLTGLDTMAPGILVWRSMLHWIGGIGIVVLSVFLFPFLAIGGQQLFQLESSERSDRPFARFGDYAAKLLQFYVAITLACMFGYLFAGMGAFDAFNHALATVSSGGFSTSDQSLGKFNSEAVLWVAIVFMLLAGLPFAWMLGLVARQRRPIDPQVRALAIFLVVTTLVLCVVLIESGTPSNYSTLTTVAFHLISIITTTGFAAEDYTIWPVGALMIVFFVTFLGACSGSTAGGIKFFRLVLFTQLLRSESASSVHPSRIVKFRYGENRLDAKVYLSALFFLASYLLVFALCAVLLSLDGLDFVTAASGSIAALANVGPGLGEIIGPAGNYSTLSPFSHWVLIFQMLAGRLEVLAIVALLAPSFWRG